MRNPWNEAWDAPDSPDPLPMPLHGMLIAEAQGRMRRSAASNEGARQLVNYFVGQVVGHGKALPGRALARPASCSGLGRVRYPTASARNGRPCLTTRAPSLAASKA